MIVFLGFHDAGIDPKKPLPAQAIVELSVIRPFTGAIGSEFRSENSQHRLPAFVGRTRAFFRQAVHGAGLFVMFQHRPLKKKEERENRNKHRSSERENSDVSPAFPVFPASFGEEVARRHLPFYPLSAQRMQFFLSHQTFVSFVVAFPG